MQRVHRLGWLLFTVFALWSRPVEAGVPDWLEELSGPGRFHIDGFANLMARPCPTRNLIQSAENVQHWCFFIDHRRFLNEKDDNFFTDLGQTGEVRAAATDFGVTFQPFKSVPLDLGAGFGFIRFHTTSGNQIIDTTRGTLTLPRLVFKPIVWSHPEFWARHTKYKQWASVLKLYARYNVILGTLDGQKDFGVVGSPFKVKNDIAFSGGFILDFSELLPQ